MNEESNVDPQEQRRAVCKALTRVVRKSKLAGELDPKAFFMMVNANYAVLYRDGLFDLSPLWEAIAPHHDAELVIGLFIQFAETLRHSGLRPVLPPQISALTAQEQQKALDAFHSTQQAAPETSDAEVVALTDELDAITSDAQAPPMLELNTGDLKPFIDPELRRTIIHSVVQAVRAAPVGERVDASQLAYLVDSNFDTLCDGHSFDLEPILGGIRELGNVFDRDLYLVPVLLQEDLREHGMTVKHHRLDVSEAEGRQLVEAHYRAKKKAQRDALLAVTHTGDTSAPPPSDSAPLPRAQAKQTKLRELGLGRGDRRTAQRVRMGILAAVLTILAVPSYVFRSDRPIAVQRYANSVPLKAAELRGGQFLGRLDGSRWWPVPLEERKKRLKTFEAIVRDQGFAPGLQVRDGKNRLLITAVGPGRLRGAPFLLHGRSDGTLIEKPNYEDAGDKPIPQIKDDEDDQDAMAE